MINMTLVKFIEEVINSGIAAAKSDYGKPGDELKLQGAIEGFEICRGESPESLPKILKMAADARLKAYRDNSDDYWRHVSFHAEIDWVCNCVSAVLVNEGRQPIVQPTYRGTLHAHAILSKAAPATSTQPERPHA